MQSNHAVETDAVISTLISNEDRGTALPDAFPKCFLEFERMVFTVARKISKDYEKSSGYWNFYKLSNGGFFIAPAHKGDLNVIIPFGNRFSGDMGAEAFGITVTLYAYCFLAEKFPESGLADHYQKLYDFMTAHSESTTIWQAID